MQGTVAVTNFTAGEWSPKLYGRVDISKYGQACTDMVNMTLIPHGAATKRMGTAFVAEAAGEEVRLVDFVYNTEQAYILEFSPNKIRFFRDGGLLPDATLATTYTWDDIRRLNFCQSADVMYLVCPRVRPRKLTRPGADAFALADVAFTAAPGDWTTDNWPGAVTFHQQRLWFGGAPKSPQKLWASMTGNFENFTTGSDDANGLSLSLVSEKVNAIRWLMSQNVLLGGTSGGEWVVYGEGGAVTPKNIQAKRNSNYGTATVRPLLVGASGIHVSADNRRLRDLAFSVVDDSYLSQDISLMGEHLVRPGIREIADCQNPDGIIWCAMNDGSLVGCTYLRAQEVIAWHRHETEGDVLSVACIPGGDYTETWLAVKRKNGVFIERMAAPWDGETTDDAACWFLDSALLHEGGEPVFTLSGLEHLEGQTVDILADGAGHPPRAVTNGSVTLAVPAKRVLVGLPYAWKLAPMRLEGLSQRGTSQGRKARLVEVMARLYKTMGLQYAWAGQAEDAYILPMREVDNAKIPTTGGDFCVMRPVFCAATATG